MSFGGAIKLTGESEYRQAISSIISDLNSLSATLKSQTQAYRNANAGMGDAKKEYDALGAALKDAGSEYNNLRSKIATLNVALQAQKTIHAMLSSEFNKAVKDLALIASTSGTASEAYAEQEKKVQSLASELAESNKEMDDAKRAQSALKTAMKDTEGALTDAEKAYDGVGDGAKDAGKEAETAGKKAKDSASGKGGWSILKQVLADLATSAIKNVISGLGKIGGAVVDVTKKFAGMVIQGGFDRAMNIEQAQFKLQGLGHDAEAVQGIMDSALASVKGTAYGLDEAVNIAASAVAAGVQSGDELTRTLSLIADASAISGDGLQEIGDLFNKVAAAGKMSANEINSFTTRGIPIMQLLSDTMGVTTGEVKALVKEGKVGFAELQNAIEKGMGGAALTMGDTFNGSISNVRAAMSRMGETIVGGATQYLTPAMGEVITLIDAATAGTTEGVEASATNLANYLSQTALGFLNTVAPMIQNILPIITTVIQTILTTLTTQLPSILELITGVLNTILQELPTFITTIVPIVVEILTQIITLVAESMPQIVDAIVQVIPTVVQGLLSLLPTLLGAVLDIVIAIIGGIAEILPDIVQAVCDVIPQLVDALIERLPDILNAAITLLMAIVQAIPVIITNLLDELPRIIETILNGLLDALPLLLDAAVQLLMMIVDSIPIIIDKLIEVLPSIITTIITTLLDHLDEIIQGAISLLMGIIRAIPTIIQVLVVKIPEIVDTIIMALLDNLPALIQGAIQLFMGILQAIPQIIGELIKAMPKIIGAIVQGLMSGLGRIWEIGKKLIEGLWNGIKDAGKWLWDKISGFFGGIMDRIKGFFGIKSPSRLFRDEIGENLALGIGEGFSDEMKNVANEMNDSIPTSFDTNIGLNNGSGIAGLTGNDSRLVNAFMTALKGVEVVMDDQTMGRFVTKTVGKAVYQY